VAGSAVENYIDATARRLASDGCRVHTEDWGGARTVIGYRADFRLRWLATKLHLFTVVTAKAHVTAADIETFTTRVLDYALARKGELRGFQSGVAAFPCLVGESVGPEAITWAEQKQRLRFACIGRPVIVDLSGGRVSTYRGRPTLGLVYAGHLRRKLEAYFAAPGAHDGAPPQAERSPSTG
jgi:hypothetical protein